MTKSGEAQKLESLEL